VQYLPTVILSHILTLKLQSILNWQIGFTRRSTAAVTAGTAAAALPQNTSYLCMPMVPWIPFLAILSYCRPLWRRYIPLLLTHAPKFPWITLAPSMHDVPCPKINYRTDRISRLLN